MISIKSASETTLNSKNIPIPRIPFQRCLRSKRNKNEFDAVSGEDLRGRGKDSSANGRAESVSGSAWQFAELDWYSLANGRAESAVDPAR
ncbi:hypothetical protein F2Q70_00043193 [Brassica cretica]|uniref:Uncharacterized protein n=1 Tax=Brassica cretica TaxID=69181 RepID=A0A8S9KMV9_BRACR|nr:hypothetical protein F2Q70_00043193 [Brassica cretica]